MKQKRNVYYGTVQIRQSIKNQLVEYCDRNGMKISRYVELLFLHHVSGSTSGSLQFLQG